MGELVGFDAIERAVSRIQNRLNTTPMVGSSILNEALGCQVHFKLECLQKVGAFKARGALNAIAGAIERGEKPSMVVCNSSGNHAQAVAWAASKYGIPATIYMPKNVSKVKAQATRAYGAKVLLCETRDEADERVNRVSKEPGVLWVPPFNDADVIAGQGTAAYEAIKELRQKGINHIDAVFAPCGGGGLLSGTLIATRHLAPESQVIGVEPLNANDAANSLRTGAIQRLKAPPNTLADGAMPMSVGALTFAHLRQLDEFYEVTEQQIGYWTQWLTHLLKVHAEPTSCMAMQGVIEYLSIRPDAKNLLVILSGGNIDSKKMSRIWREDYLNRVPSRNLS